MPRRSVEGSRFAFMLPDRMAWQLEQVCEHTGEAKAELVRRVLRQWLDDNTEEEHDKPS